MDYYDIESEPSLFDKKFTIRVITRELPSRNQNHLINQQNKEVSRRPMTSLFGLRKNSYQTENNIDYTNLCGEALTISNPWKKRFHELNKHKITFKCMSGKHYSANYILQSKPKDKLAQTNLFIRGSLLKKHSRSTAKFHNSRIVFPNSKITMVKFLATKFNLRQGRNFKRNQILASYKNNNKNLATRKSRLFPN